MKLAALMLAAMACGTSANAQSNDLLTAAGRGDLPAVNALLTAGADVNEATNTVLGPTTALMEATSKGHLAVVEALIAAKADLNATRGHKAKDGDTALVLATLNGDLSMVQALLAARADVDAGSRPPLYYAAMLGNLDIVRALLTAKPNLEWRDPQFGTTALMQALAPWRDNFLKPLAFPRGRLETAQLLVQAGANVNAISKTGVTPLLLVAEKNNSEGLALVQMLLAAHADESGGGIAPNRGPLSLAPLSDGGNYSRGGYTALGLAASTGTVEVVQALLDANTQRAANPSFAVNTKQPEGNTPLTLASAKGRADVVRLLLAANADVSAVNSDGKTALMLATENNHPDVADLLRTASSRP